MSDSEYPSYKVFMKKIWHDLRPRPNLSDWRPHTKLQWIAFALHINMLIAFILPCIVAQGHITNLRPIVFSTLAQRDPQLLAKFLHIWIQFLSTSYCISLLAVTVQLYNQDWASNSAGKFNIWNLRFVVYFILVVTLNAVMAVVVKCDGTQAWYKDRPAINTYTLRVDSEPYYICLWLSVAISLLGATYCLGSKRRIYI